jgi:phage terminase Nu1 subunit (DNA packaging protein)
MESNTGNSTQSPQGSSLSQFFTTVVAAATTAIVMITIFVIIRTKFKRIYEPKIYIGDEKRRVAPLPTSLCGWLPALFRIPQEDLIRTSGLDAYFFARYIYVHAVFFLCSFVLLAIILFPIYVVDGKGEAYGKMGLDILTFGNIAVRNSSRYGAPLVLAFIFIGAYLYLLYSEMKAFVEKRQALLRSPAYQSRASATTILVTTIPNGYMSHDVLFRIFNQFPGGVKHIWLNRNLGDLPDKAEKRTALVETLEAAECKMIQTALKNEAKRQKKISTKVGPVVIEEAASDVEEGIVQKYISEKERPTMKIGPIPLLSSLCLGKKVDTITYCTETISQLNTEIEREKTTPDNYKVMNSAFIQFNKQIAAHMAVQSVAASVPLAMTPRYIDVKPANIVWSNLKLTFYERKGRELAMLAATAALIVFWAIPVAFVGVLSNLTYLTNTLTFLQFICNLPTVLIGLITGLLPAVLLAVLMALLPIVLKLFAKLSGIPTTDAIDRYVQGSYFVFQVVHVFLVVTISSSVSSVVQAIIENPPSAATILAANIPTASNFFFSFMALQGLSMSSGLLLQIVALILFYLLGKLLDNTPRKKWRREFTLSSLGWGTIFPVFTNFVVISLVYSIIAPLILIISGLAFVLFYVAYIYTMFYVSDFPNDTGGLAFPRAIYQSFTGIYMMEIMLAALFFLAQNESHAQSALPEGVLMCVLVVITIGVQYVMSSSFDHLTFYLPVDAEEFPRSEIPDSKITAWPKTAIRVLTHSTTTGGADVASNINDAAVDTYENTMENAYMHPAIRDPKPIVWIAQDSLGIAADEVQRHQASGLDIQISTDRARFNEKNNIDIDGPPPDYVEPTDKNYVQTRF